MLIDSHPVMLWGLKNLIDGSGKCSVCASASNITQALKQIDEHAPDIVVLDPDLDNENGMDFIPVLLQRCRARVIVYTGLRDSESHDLAIVKGARGILKKTDLFENLLKAIEKIHQGELWVNRDATSRILMQIAQANAPKVITPEQAKIAYLTPKEDKIACTLLNHSERPLKEIAKLLHISEHTLRNHLASIYEKLGTRNRLELYVFCSKHMV